MTNKELKLEFSNLLARIKQSDFLKQNDKYREKYIYAIRKIIRLLDSEANFDLSFWISVFFRLKENIDLYQKERKIDTVGVDELLNIIFHAIEDNEINSLNSSNFYEAEVNKLTEKIKKNSNVTDNYIRTVHYIDEKEREISKLKEELEFIKKQLEEEKEKGLAKSLKDLKTYATYIELKEELSKTKKDLNEAKAKKEELEDLKNEIGKQKKLVEQYKSELQKAKEKESAIENWEKKIKDAFNGLKGPISRLQAECDRLEFLYQLYAFISLLVIMFLLAIEFVIYYKIYSSTSFLKWEQYWPMVLPVPVAVGLLWGFITQMNRSQRQLVILANQIYEIEYIEGLLLALNTLSVDIGDSMVKINDAISRLIDNHINNMFIKKMDENKLADIEKQNSLPIDKIPELIKLLKNK